MTEPTKFIIGAAPGEVIDWDNDPRVRTLRPQPIEALLSAPPLTYEYGARDPDDHSRINTHRGYAAAREAAAWWGIDNKVYQRKVTPWEEMDD